MFEILFFELTFNSSPYCPTYYFMVYFNGIQAPIAQGIERRSPEPGAQVRFLLGAPLISLDSHRF